MLTNDGDLAARLTHPRHGVTRVYEAQVLGVPDDHDLERLAKGIVIDGRRTEPAEVSCWRTDATPTIAHCRSRFAKDAIARCARCARPSAIRSTRCAGRDRTAARCAAESRLLAGPDADEVERLRRRRRDAAGPKLEAQEPGSATALSTAQSSDADRLAAQWTDPHSVARSTRSASSLPRLRLLERQQLLGRRLLDQRSAPRGRALPPCPRPSADRPDRSGRSESGIPSSSRRGTAGRRPACGRRS